MSGRVGFSTLVGSGALLLWAFEPLVVAELQGFPLFESLTMVFASCFILTAIRVTIAKKWKLVLNQPLFIWLFGLFAICGSDFTYMLGAYCAPIAHVDLIDYMWPGLIVVFISFLPNERFSLKYLIGACLGLFGVWELVCAGEGLNGFKLEYSLGYLLAIYGVIIWGAYFAYCRTKPSMPVDMVGIYCGFGAILTGIAHLSLEQTVVPTFSQSGLAIILGLAGPGLAYQLWAHGIKFGNAKWLSVACYFARIMAMVLLVFFGKEPLSKPLIMACSFALLGVIISSINWEYLYLKFLRLFTVKKCQY